MRVCSEPGCPELVARGSWCMKRGHAQQRESARGSRQARGYDARHDQLRRQWEPQVATGNVSCWRCHRKITPGEPWDLGHDDNDRTKYRGPEHAGQCNRAAAGRRRRPR